MKVALLGLGEVGRTLVEDLRSAGVGDIAAYDILFADPGSRPSRNAAELGLARTRHAAEAAVGASLVISAVTAANALAAARSVEPSLRPGSFFLDLNSASPRQKQAAAAAIHHVCGRYVEAAVMAPIHPKRIAAPMLLGGPHVAEFLAFAGPLGFSGCERYADEIGPASATKLCRSVMIKGVEALLTESMLAARAWGVEGKVLGSLSNLLPADDWERLAHYMIARSLEHGARRGEEMREAAETVRDTGIEPLMANATARRQEWAASFGKAAGETSVAAMIDAIRAKFRFEASQSASQPEREGA